MTDDFERRIRRDLDAIGAAVPVDPAVPLAEADAAGRGPWLVMAAAVVLVVGALVWSLGQRDDESSPTDVANTTTSSATPTTSARPVTTDPAVDPPAPPVDTGTHEIWIANPVVAESGGIVVFAMVGPPGDEVFGIVFSVERWDGAEWQHVGGATSCFYPRCAAELIEGADPIIVGTVGNSVGESGVGGAEALNVDGFEPGWYRIGRGVAEDDVARGVFQVVADDEMPSGPPAPAVVADDEYAWAVSPPVIPTTGARVRASVVGPAPEPNAIAVDQIVERWTRDGWTGVFAMGTASGDLSFVLPALPAGDYRMVPRGGDAPVGRFWVSDGLAGEAVCPGIPDLDALVGEATPFGTAVPGDGRTDGQGGSFHVQWESDEAVVDYVFPAEDWRVARNHRVAGPGFEITDSVTAPGGGSSVEVRVFVDGGCAFDDSPIEFAFARGSFIVSSADEQSNFVLARRLGAAFAERWGDVVEPTGRTRCPDGSTDDDRSESDVYRSVFMYCRRIGDAESVLAPVAVSFAGDGAPEAVVEGSLSDPWNGLETAIPIELRWADNTVALADGILTIDWGWDFAADPIGAEINSAHNAKRIVDQIAANAFQFEEVDSIDLGDLPLDVDQPFIYTREQWERAQVDE